MSPAVNITLQTWRTMCQAYAVIEAYCSWLIQSLQSLLHVSMLPSAPNLDTIVHCLITVKEKVKKEQQHAVRFLIDTGATESCIQKLLSLELVHQ